MYNGSVYDKLGVEPSDKEKDSAMDLWFNAYELRI